jgi:excinuclease ABC subunit C
MLRHTESNAKLREKLGSLPQKPGCYLYRDVRGQVIYVGKAVNLRSRVRSYFQAGANHTPKVRRLVHEVCDLEWFVTETELEALVLECNLIKRHRPHFNVRLRDDKHYPYICLTTSEPFPRLMMTRRIRQDGNRYFGPYTGARPVYAIMDLMKRIFPVVSCGKRFTGEAVQKPCIYHSMGQCLAPCAGLAKAEEYARAVRDATTFLEGKQERILNDLRRRMARASDALQFEVAARLRDQISAVEQVLSRQKVISSRLVDQDVVALVAEDGGACVQMFYIRGGKLIGQNSYLLEGADAEEPTGAAVQEFVKQYYQNAAYVPQEVLLPCDIDEASIIESWLRQKRGSKVEISVPLRGDKKRLVEMATENASDAMGRMRAEVRARLGNTDRALADLAQALGLDGPPHRIECYDISNFQAEAFVGSMVVCEGGMMTKQEYRRFRIREHEGRADDPGMMREVLTRRLRDGVAGDEKFARMPDLIIVDGGSGQLTAALAAMEEVGVRLPVCGLAKRFELLIVPGREEPVALERTSQALYLVQRIRDEAHRFANAYRVMVQAKRQTKSVLDAVPGIGPKRRKALVKHFGSIARIKSAEVDELSAAPGMNQSVALSLYTYLREAAPPAAETP